MGAPFAVEYVAQWSDMDFNQHMANTAFLAYAGDIRTQFADARGFTISRFAELRIGPVVLEDRLTYQREIRLLETFTLDVQLAACTPDVRRFKIRNRFSTGGDRLCATVDSIGLWLDLDDRRPTTPPHDLRDAWLSLQRSEDFEDWR
jgi:acyl-CoA thioester hydrolase